MVSDMRRLDDLLKAYKDRLRAGPRPVPETDWWEGHPDAVLTLLLADKGRIAFSAGEDFRPGPRTLFGLPVVEDLTCDPAKGLVLRSRFKSYWVITADGP